MLFLPPFAPSFLAFILPFIICPSTTIPAITLPFLLPFQPSFPLSFFLSLLVFSVPFRLKILPFLFPLVPGVLLTFLPSNSIVQATFLFFAVIFLPIYRLSSATLFLIAATATAIFLILPFHVRFFPFKYSIFTLPIFIATISGPTLLIFGLAFLPQMLPSFIAVLAIVLPAIVV